MKSHLLIHLPHPRSSSVLTFSSSRPPSLTLFPEHATPRYRASLAPCLLSRRLLSPRSWSLMLFSPFPAHAPTPCFWDPRPGSGILAGSLLTSEVLRMGKLKLRGTCPRSATASGTASWGWADPSLTGSLGIAACWWRGDSARHGGIHVIVGLQHRESRDEAPQLPRAAKLRGLLQAEAGGGADTTSLHFSFILPVYSQQEQRPGARSILAEEAPVGEVASGVLSKQRLQEYPWDCSFRVTGLRGTWDSI